MIGYALLGLLRVRSDHGYQLKIRFERLLGPSWRLNIGQVYQTLRSLERRRLVVELHEAATDAEVPAAQRSRRRFSITALGIRALDRWLAHPAPRLPLVRDELPLQMLVLDGDRRGAWRPLLKGRQRLYRRHVTKLVAFRSRLASNGDAALANRLAIEGQLLQAQAYLAWLELCERALDEGFADAERMVTAAPAGTRDAIVEHAVRNVLSVRLAERGWSDVQLAAASGLGRLRVNRVKNRQARPTTREALVLGAALGLRVADLFTLEDPPARAGVGRAEA